ncbi:hypothetical protein JKA74_08610 [Marivirga sp. S37H4]|uniref:Tetratricopeptide repeat protein n=1 Tax=Marivirga aurantiaca TaxID=2802615 RepID=A0A934WY81_9BACT|nr:hypothetical protein [Marivirga aurantiaca]MBK6265097.1 hypothetical protein [Marivirga aurantiaca]
MTRKFYTLLLLLAIFQQACGQLDRETENEIDKVVEYFNNKEYNKALTYTDKLIAKDSLDYVTWTMKGRALFNSGRQEEGIKAVNKAIEINPDYYEAYGYRAIMSKLTGDYNAKQVLDDFEIATLHDQENFKLLKSKAGFLYMTGQYEKALNEYDGLLKFYPNDYSIIVLHSTTNSKLGKQELALKGYNKAIEIDSIQSFAYEQRGFLFIEQEKYEQAIKEFNKVIQLIQKNKELDPVEAYNYNNRGFAYHKAGNNKQALKDINHSLKLLSSNSYAYKNRAIVYFDMENNIKGCEDLKKAVELGFSQQYGDEVEKLIIENCK